MQPRSSDAKSDLSLAIQDLRFSSVLTADLLRNRLQLQIRRALVDLSDLRVAVELLDGVVLDEAVAAEEIDGERRGALRRLPTRRACTSPLRSGTAGRGRAGARRCRRAAARLRRRSRLAPAGTARPGTRRSPCRTACAPSCTRSRARARRRPARASARRCRSGLRSASRSRPCSPCRPRRATFAPRDAAVLEEQLARARRADAELVFLLADREARRAAIDDETR